MNTTRGISVLALIVLIDSLWLYPVLGVFGLATNQGGAPLAWSGVLTILAAGFTIDRIMVLFRGSGPATYMVLTVTGLGAVFLAIAANLAGSPGSGWDLAWFARMTRGDVSGPEVITIVTTMLCTAYLWRRAIRIADEPVPADRLRTTFRTGTLAIAVVLIVELVTSVNLDASQCLVPFFILALGGLALLHRPRTRSASHAWTKVTAVTVALVVGLGFLVALLGGEVNATIVSAASYIWTNLLTAAAWLLELVLSPILELFFKFIEWIKPEGGGLPRPVNRPEIDWDRLEVEKAAPFVDAVVDFLRYPLIALFLYLLIRYLIRTHRLWNTLQRSLPVEVAIEPMEAEGDSLRDISRIIDALIPDWLRGGNRARRWHYPSDRPGFSEVFQLYFQMLDVGANRGAVLRRDATPNERLAELKEVLPHAPVNDITERFNAACYGKYPSDSEAVAQLRERLEERPNRSP